LQLFARLQGRVGVAGGILKRQRVGLEQRQHDLVATDVLIMVNVLGDVPEILAAPHRAVGVQRVGGRHHPQQENGSKQWKTRVHQAPLLMVDCLI
jgi:hypothetical protein